MLRLSRPTRTNNKGRKQRLRKSKPLKLRSLMIHPIQMLIKSSWYAETRKQRWISLRASRCLNLMLKVYGAGKLKLIMQSCSEGFPRSGCMGWIMISSCQQICQRLRSLHLHQRVEKILEVRLRVRTKRISQSLRHSNLKPLNVLQLTKPEDWT